MKKAYRSSTVYSYGSLATAIQYGDVGPHDAGARLHLWV